MRARLTAAVVSALVGAGVWAAAADAAFVGREAARSYLLKAVPAAAPGVMLGDARAGFFRTERMWVQRAERCRRRSEVAVSCRFTARLVPDASHRRQNWWPIECRGTLIVGLDRGGRLQGDQGHYTCRTIRR